MLEEAEEVVLLMVQVVQVVQEQEVHRLVMKDTQPIQTLALVEVAEDLLLEVEVMEVQE